MACHLYQTNMGYGVWQAVISTFTMWFLTGVQWSRITVWWMGPRVWVFNFGKCANNISLNAFRPEKYHHCWSKWWGICILSRGSGFKSQLMVMFFKSEKLIWFPGFNGTWARYEKLTDVNYSLWGINLLKIKPVVPCGFRNNTIIQYTFCLFPFTKRNFVTSSLKTKVINNIQDIAARFAY